MTAWEAPNSLVPAKAFSAASHSRGKTQQSSVWNQSEIWCQNQKKNQKKNQSQNAVWLGQPIFPQGA